MKALLILLGLLVISVDADAQSWSRTHGPVEDEVLDLCIDSNGILYAVTPFGLNRSTDAGDRWTRPRFFNRQVGESRLIVARNGNVIFGCDSGIAVTSDQGITFKLTYPQAISNPIIDLAVTQSGKLFAVMKSSFIVSLDHGKTWKAVSQEGMLSTALTPTALAASHDTLIAMIGVLHHSTNEGLTWHGQFTGLNAEELSIHSDGSWINVTAGSIYRSVGHDLNWKQLGQGRTFDLMPDGRAIVASGSALWLLQDMNSPWQDITAGLENDSISIDLPSRVVYDPTRGIYFAATPGHGVYRRNPPLDVRTSWSPVEPLHVFPNPAVNELTLEFAGAVSIRLIEVFDDLGRRRLHKQYTNVQGEVKLDISGLSTGSYLLSILDDSGRRLSRWIAVAK